MSKKETYFAIEIENENPQILDVCIKTIGKATEEEKLAIEEGFYQFLSHASPAENGIAAAVINGFARYVVKNVPLKVLTEIYEKIRTDHAPAAPGATMAFPMHLKKGGPLS